MAANATTPDELPGQPRKTSWKRWTLAFACVLAIALAVLFLKAPAPEPVSVRFVGSTNDDGRKMLIFKGTNGTAKAISCRAYFTTDLTASSHPWSLPVCFHASDVQDAG